MFLFFYIQTKSDQILSALFVFNTIEWIACLSHQHLLFYHINWNSKPLRIAIQRESEVQVKFLEKIFGKDLEKKTSIQNIYTGAVACDNFGERLIVGDKIGSIHVWRLIDNEPNLVTVKESIVEVNISLISVDKIKDFLLFFRMMYKSLSH